MMALVSISSKHTVLVCAVGKSTCMPGWNWTWLCQSCGSVGDIRDQLPRLLHVGKQPGACMAYTHSGSSVVLTRTSQRYPFSSASDNH